MARVAGQSVTPIAACRARVPLSRGIGVPLMATEETIWVASVAPYSPLIRSLIRSAVVISASSADFWPLSAASTSGMKMPQ